MRASVILLSTALGLALAAPALAQDRDGDGVLDGADAFPDDPNAVAAAYYPAQDGTAMILVEDQWPNDGDLDFNDVVLGYNLMFRLDGANRVTRIDATLDVQALGGIFSMGLGWHLPVPRTAVAAISRRLDGGPALAVAASNLDADLVLDVSGNLRTELFQNAQGPLNSDPAAPYVEPVTVTVTIDFTTGVALDLAAAPFDVFAFHAGDRAHEIHDPAYGGTAAVAGALFGTGDDRSQPGRWYTNAGGMPFLLHLPAGTPYPKEGVPISALFPDILQFAASGGATHTNFYTSNVVTSAAFRSPEGSYDPTLTMFTGCYLLHPAGTLGHNDTHVFVVHEWAGYIGVGGPTEPWQLVNHCTNNLWRPNPSYWPSLFRRPRQ